MNNFTKEVMDKVSIVLLLVLICGCSSMNQKMNDGIERIPIDVHNVSRDASLFIDKIELVPLETNDSSLLHKYRKVMYDKETDVYAVYTVSKSYLHSRVMGLLLVIRKNARAGT